MTPEAPHPGVAGVSPHRSEASARPVAPLRRTWPDASTRPGRCGCCPVLSRLCSSHRSPARRVSRTIGGWAAASPDPSVNYARDDAIAVSGHRGSAFAEKDGSLSHHVTGSTSSGVEPENHHD